MWGNVASPFASVCALATLGKQFWKFKNLKFRCTPVTNFDHGLGQTRLPLCQDHKVAFPKRKKRNASWALWWLTLAEHCARLQDAAFCGTCIHTPLPLPSPKLPSSCPLARLGQGSYFEIWGRGGGRRQGQSILPTPSFCIFWHFPKKWKVKINS